MAVYSLGISPWPAVILQVPIARMNNSRGSFLDMEEEDLAVVILDYGDC